jgi:predicted ABC-type exoprotein transport system permease subunit
MRSTTQTVNNNTNSHAQDTTEFRVYVLLIGMYRLVVENAYHLMTPLPPSPSAKNTAKVKTVLVRRLQLSAMLNCASQCRTVDISNGCSYALHVGWCPAAFVHI